MKTRIIFVISALLITTANCIHGKGKWEKGVQNIYVINATGKKIMLAYSIPAKEKNFVKGVLIGKLGLSEGVWLHPPLGKKISKLIWIFPDSPNNNEPLNARYVYSAGHHLAHLNPNTSATREIRIHPKSNRGKSKENPGLEQTIPKKIGKWGGIWPATKNTEFVTKTNQIFSLMAAGDLKGTRPAMRYAPGGRKKTALLIGGSQGLYDIYPYDFDIQASFLLTKEQNIRKDLWLKVIRKKILEQYPNIEKEIEKHFGDSEDR